ncbi:dehydrogenase/reductase SDR family member 11-like isoform X2 [Anneissia japonica]|uniref:dehydrogenase/reductase SDR family member 11-like isoform X2 n=1 Tax=Anneissia japonica TaxID=1529436 RepID=UPI0014254FC5|nr:dehydrogenase/reductase SDR family member 11-like isoform X2 [Anneissia japonica]
MSERWVGRVALVTGASVGIGAAIARKLVGHGMKVVGCANNGFDKVKAIAEELKSQNAPGLLHPVKCDVSKEADILAMFSEIKDKFGGVDVCVNNAGLSFECPLMSGKTEHWRYMLEVNVLALAVCTREAISQMIEKGVDDGHIFHINSMSGHRVAASTSPIGFYSGTKHMVTAMTEGLRQELRSKKSHIRVTSISPGMVETEFAIRMRGEERGKQIYSQIKNLAADDIADSLVHALHAPPHCQIHDILIRPIEQET